MSAAAPGPRPPSAAEFARFQELVQCEAGIHLSSAKQALLVGRLSRRLRQLELESFGAYLGLVERDPEERRHMLDCLCTNETRFFREPRQFEYLEHTLLPAWSAEAAAGLRRRRLRVWSAACSTGEEPYSLAMLLLTAFPPATGWELEVLATDLSTRALAQAEAAVWPIERAREIPPHLLRRFMLQGVSSQIGRMRAGPELRALVRIRRVNLNDEHYAALPDCDLILCRNVLIYFPPDVKLCVVERLLRHLAPGGRLLLGHAESLAGMNTHVQVVGPNAYTPVQEMRPWAAHGRCGSRP